jgi:hypothetical protein
MIRKTTVCALLICVLGLFTPSVAPASPAVGTATVEALPDFVNIDVKALRGADASARDKEINRILAAPDRFAPIVFAIVSRALFQAGRTDEARLWYGRGQMRMLIDVEFSKTEFNADLDEAPSLYDAAAGGGGGSSDKFLSFMRQTGSDAALRTLSEALEWDKATPRNYRLSWLLDVANEGLVKPLDGTLKPGWEARMAATQARVTDQFVKFRKAKSDAVKAAAADAAAATSGGAAADASEASADPLDPAFAAVAKAVRTLDLNGCVALPGQPMDDKGETLLVRCPDFKKVELATGRVLKTWSYADLAGSSACAPERPIWPPGSLSLLADASQELAVSARTDSIFVRCSVQKDSKTHGALAALQLPVLRASRGSAFAPLVVDASGTGIDPDQTRIEPFMQVSADGRWLLLEAWSGASRFGLLVDLDSRKARALRPEEAPMQGLAQPYKGYLNAHLIGEPAAVVAETNRPLPQDSKWDSAQTIMIWPVDGSPPKGLDLNRHTNIFGPFTPMGLHLDRGLVPLFSNYCRDPCPWQTSNAPPNVAPGFRSTQFGHNELAQRLWIDPRDLWTGTMDEAKAKYGSGSGAAHCEAGDGEVVLARRWAVAAFAGRKFAGSGPVWCAFNSAARRLVVGVGRYAHVYDVGGD